MTDFDDSWVDVQAKIDGVWESITYDYVDGVSEGRVRNNPGVIITRGKSVNEQRTAPMECEFVINNRDGKYSRDNPRSVLWKKLGINTEIRVVAEDYESYVLLPTNQPGDTALCISAPDSAIFDVSDMELRIDFEPEHYYQKTYPLLTKYGITGDQRSYWLGLTAGGFPILYWSTNGTLAARRSALCDASIPSGRFTLRVTIDVNNGAGGVDVTFYTGPTITGAFTMLGTVQTSASTSSIHSGTANVGIGSTTSGSVGISDDAFTEYLVGKVYGARFYAPIGTLQAEADFTNVELEDTTYSDGTTTFTVNDPAVVVSDRIRFSGEVPSWPVTWDSTGTDVTVAIKAYGILRSLNDGAQALDSPMRAYYSSVDNCGYWHCEDLTDSTFISAVTPNTRPARATNIEYAAVGDLPGSLDVMKIIEGSSVVGVFPQQSNTGEYAFTFAYFMDDSPAVDVTAMQLVTSEYTFKVVIGAAAYTFSCISSDGTVLSTSTTGFGAGGEPGNWIVFVLEAEQNGANVDWIVNWRTLDPAIGYANGSASFAGSVGILRSWNVPGLPASTGLSTFGIGHVAGIRNIDVYLEGAHLDSFRGYALETVVERLTRLCDEQNIAFRYKGISKDDVEILGPQSVGTFPSLLDDAIKVGRGILCELRDRLGLLYITRTELENQTPFTFAYSDSILSGAPVLDDNPLIVNDVIANRPEGGYSRETTVTGPRGTDTIRAYILDDTYNVYSDKETRNLAGWIRHIGSWDDIYYSSIQFNIARNDVQDDAYVIHGLIGLDLGNAIEITDLPDFLPIRPAALLLEKYREELTRSQWIITQETSAFRPYLTAQTNLYPLARMGSNTSTLGTGIDDNDVSLSVAVSNTLVRWVFSSQFYIEIDNREKALVTAISGSSSPFTFTVTRGTPAFAHDAGVSIRLWDQRVISY